MHNVLYLIGTVERIGDAFIILKVTGETTESSYYFKCNLNNNTINNVLYESLKVNDLVGIKGKLQQQENNINIIVERMSYLSSTKK